MRNDFSKGSVVFHILNLSVPMTIAQLINVLYNVIDRMYIGRMPENATLSLTGVGITLPIISIVIAFANLFGMGGAPLCSIARGRGDTREAEYIMGNSFTMLVISSLILTAFGFLYKQKLLFMFGASNDTFHYANEYITIYLLGNIFVMIGLGMNSFINSQGFAKTAMITVLLGAVTNIVLDPIFIFVLNMGVKGAATATVISQFLSAFWILLFLVGKKTILKLKISNMKLKKERVFSIISLGLSNFTMSITNGAVQIACNATLQVFGGDIYVGVMTIINAVREIVSMPITGVTHGAQPVIGYNYGYGNYDRVKTSIKIITFITVIYTIIGWALINIFPEFFIRLFNDDIKLIDIGVRTIRIYFFGFFMMALQFCSQSVFVALGKSKKAIFFSLLRKVFIVVPLTLILPRLWNLGVNGVFIAEPVSNFIGGTAAFIVMLATVLPELKKKDNDKKQIKI